MTHTFSTVRSGMSTPPLRAQLLSSFALERAALAIWNVRRQLQGLGELAWRELTSAEQREAMYAALAAVRRLDPTCRAVALREATQALYDATEFESGLNRYRELDWTQEDTLSRRRIASHTVNAFLEVLDGRTAEHLRMVAQEAGTELPVEHDAGKPGALLSTISAVILLAKRRSRS